jgi:DNA-binding NarL/FixJ family response regulator
MIKILIADDHRMFRDGLRTLLEKQKNTSIVGETKDGPETFDAAIKLRPDVIIMDISMPGLNGIETTRKILNQIASIKILMLSMHSDKRYVTESLKAGAVGYLLKDSAFEELITAIRTISENGIYLSAGVNDSVIREYIAFAKGSAKSPTSILSAREREVLQMLAEGKTTKETASSLNVSVKTIETHRKQIMDKLDIHSIAELTKYAIREGLTSLE